MGLVFEDVVIASSLVFARLDHQIPGDVWLCSQNLGIKTYPDMKVATGRPLHSLMWSKACTYGACHTLTSTSALTSCMRHQCYNSFRMQQDLLVTALPGLLPCSCCLALGKPPHAKHTHELSQHLQG